MGTTHRRCAVGLTLAAVLLSGLAQSPPASGQASALNGSAYGAFVKVGLFGGPPSQVGAAPVVVLPPTGGEKEQSLPELRAQFGPATIFGGQWPDGTPAAPPSGKLTVATEGKTGAGAFVTSSATIESVGPGPLIADEITSTCRADEGGVTGSVEITKGVVETSYNVETQEAATTVDVPENPAPNTAVEGTIDHVGDRYRIVFNEQVVEGDTIIVRAAHMYLLGNIAVGDLIVGQSVCGLSADDDGSTAPPLDPNAPPTTEAPATTTTTGDPELAADTDEAGSDGGGAAVVVVAVAGALGLGALVAVRRRRRQPAP